MASGRCPLVVGLVCAGLAGACSAKKLDAGSQRASADAGAFDAAAGLPEAAPRLSEAAAITPVPPRDAATRDAGSMCPRATATRTQDAEATTLVDASGPVVDGGDIGDAGAPPEDCLAPCIWALVRHCPPPSACTVQDYGTAATEFLPAQVSRSEHLACGENDWWDSRSDGYPSNNVDNVYVAGRHCYGVSFERPGTSFGMTGWSDGTENVAVMVSNDFAGGPDGQTFCGRDIRLPCVSDEDCQSKGIVRYDVQGTAARCAPWRRIIEAAFGIFRCQKGCCPTDPPVIPPLL